MKLFNKIAFSLCALLLMSACAEDYLETVPTSATSTATIFETTANAALAINGLNKLMTSQLLGQQGFNGEGTVKMFYGNYAGNHFFVNQPGFAPIINAQFNESVSSLYCYYPWYYYYSIIGNANAIIANIDAATGPQSDKSFIKAQAFTFRAYAYMMLSQLYCYRWADSNQGASAGLVLRLDTSTGDMPLSTLREVYASVYGDLNNAISLFDESGKRRKANYEVGIEVAYATYARAALNRQDYATAASMAVKARQDYPLMTNGEYQAGFSQPNQEWIWSSYGAQDETLHFYSYFAYIAYNSSASAVRTLPKCISKELYDQIPTTDLRRNLFLNPGSLSYTLSTGRSEAALDKFARENYPTIQSNATVYAYMQYKISATDLPGVGNLNHFRSAEMYLIEAEAKHFGNDAVGAQNALVALNRTSGRDLAYSCTKTGAALLAEIKTYRAIELWGEGFDWFDMKRWGDSIVRRSSAAGGNFLASLAVTITPTEANRWTWKIPLRETDYNAALSGALQE